MRNGKIFSFSIFWVALLFSTAWQSYAQIACLPATWEVQDSPYWRASFVFAGVVDKFRIDRTSVSPEGYFTTDSYTPASNLASFTVEKMYRGDLKKQIEIISSFNFKEGERYFVYASLGKDGKIYQLDNGICGKPPILLADARDDIEYAEEIASGKIGTRIFGSVVEDRWRLWEPRRALPLANIEVTIKSKKQAFTARTNDNGQFDFKNIPPAVYEIAVAIPKGLHKRTFKNLQVFPKRSGPDTVSVGERSVSEITPIDSTQKPKTYFHHWNYRNFVFTSLSSIEGKIVDSDGKIPPQQFLWLLPIGKDGKQVFDDVQSVWIDRSSGKFVFDNIPSGKYRIVINRNNCHTDRNAEFGREFFPGTRSEAEAATITVGENQTLTLRDLRLLPALEERQFSGVTLTADKKPLANATVFMINRRSSSYPDECFATKIETKTDESGHFRLKGYQGYEYRIGAYIQATEQPSSRLFSKLLELPVNADVENIELILGPPN